jgi:hypothetical protein
MPGGESLVAPLGVSDVGLSASVSDASVAATQILDGCAHNP